MTQRGKGDSAVTVAGAVLLALFIWAFVTLALAWFRL